MLLLSGCETQTLQGRAMCQCGEHVQMTCELDGEKESTSEVVPMLP